MSVPDAATAHDRHVGRYGAQLAAGLIAVAAVHRGQRALDARSGMRRFDAASDRVGEIADGRRVGWQRPEELGDLFEDCGLADIATGELLAADNKRIRKESGNGRQ